MKEKIRNSDVYQKLKEDASENPQEVDMYNSNMVLYCLTIG